LLLRHHTTAAASQLAQHGERLCAKGSHRIRVPQLPRVLVEGKCSELDRGGVCRRRALPKNRVCPPATLARCVGAEGRSRRGGIRLGGTLNPSGLPCPESLGRILPPMSDAKSATCTAKAQCCSGFLRLCATPPVHDEHDDHPGLWQRGGRCRRAVRRLAA